MRELALFSGAGGGILGGKLLGWRTVCAVEINSYCRSVLLARQRDGILDPFPIWDDVRSFDGKQWRGNVDVVSGGFPCQDISAAGKGAGIDGERSGLWVEMARIIREVRPRYAFVENSPMLTSRGLGTVLGDLAEMGFDAEWGVYSAGEQGAPHERARIWIVAHADVPERGEERKARHRLAEQSNRIFRFWKESPGGARSFRDALTYSRGVDAGMARRMERLTAIGNGQVPCVAASAWRLLSSNAQVERPDRVRSDE